MLATTVLILIVFLPIALLPMGLRTLFSPSELNEMGISLEKPEPAFPVEMFIPTQAYELVGFLPASKRDNISDGCTGELSQPLQLCP